MLRPICGPVLLKVVWFGFLASEVIGMTTLMAGTYGVYSTLNIVSLLGVFWQSILLALVRIGLVRVFLEMASILVPSR